MILKKGIVLCQLLLVLTAYPLYSLGNTESSSGSPEDGNNLPIEEHLTGIEVVLWDWSGYNNAVMKAAGTDPRNNPWISHIADQTGVVPQFTFLPYRGYIAMVNLMAAAGEEFDLFIGNQPSDWLANRVFTPLNTLLKNHTSHILPSLPERAIRAVTVQGEISGVPIPEYRQVKQVLLIRKDWLDQLGIPVPETVQDFEAFLRAVRSADLDMNGKHDEYGLSLDTNFTDVFVLGGAWGVPAEYEEGYEINTEKGEINFWGVSEYAREMFTVISRWFSSDLIDPDSLFQHRKDQRSDFISGKSATFRDSIKNIPEYELAIFEVSGTVPEIIPLPPLKGPEKRGYRANFDADRVFYVYSGSKKKKETLQFLDYFFTEDGKNFALNGLEGIDYSFIDNSVIRKPLSERKTGLQPAFLPFAFQTAQEYWDAYKKEQVAAYMGLFSAEEAERAAERNLGFQLHANEHWGYETELNWKNQIDISSLPSVQSHPDFLGPYREYRLRFYAGELNPQDNSHWSEFISELTSAGIFTVLEEAEKSIFNKKGSNH